MSNTNTARAQQQVQTLNHNRKDPHSHHEDDVVEIHYEQKLRQVFFDSASDDGRINNESDWDCLIAMFLKNRLISLDDIKKLERVRPSFPMTFSTLAQTICQSFGDGQIKQLNEHISDSKEQLENCRTCINMLNVKSLSSNEIYQLAMILYHCQQKAKETQKNLKKVVNKVKGLSEDSYAFVWDKIPMEHNLQSIQLPHLTYQQDKASIEKEFSERRVRQVHYRKQAIKVLKEYDSGMLKVIAYCADKDFSVECYQIPKCFPFYEILNQFYNQIGASKQLLKCKYFQSYLGFDDMSNDEYNLYFFDIKRGKPLKLLLTETNQVLKDEQQLFRFWAKEILYALQDITYKSTYNIKGDISLKNVYISDLGIKIYLKKIKYGELRDETVDYHLQVESKMLHDYGKLLIEMLSDEANYVNNLILRYDDILQNLDIDPELKAIIFECLHAKDKISEKEQENYDNEINQFILQEKLKKQKKEQEQEGYQTQQDFQDLIAYKKQQEKIQLQQEEEQQQVNRKISRKSGNPEANKKNYDRENRDFGVKSEVDMVLQRIAGQKSYNSSDAEFKFAQNKFDKSLIGYSGDRGVVKQKKGERYLTVQSLLDHPYFIGINTADISSVIDQYEDLVNNFDENIDNQNYD